LKRNVAFSGMGSQPITNTRRTMRKILSLVSAALTLAACSNPTAPGSVDRSADVAKAKAALGAVAKANGRLSAN
jgi:hypothetical protein